MAAKAALKDAGRALDMPYGDVDRLAKLVPQPAEYLAGRGAEAIAAAGSRCGRKTRR